MQKKGKILGTLLGAALYAVIMGAAYTVDTEIRDGFMQTAPPDIGKLPQTDRIFSAPVRETDPFATTAPAKKDSGSAPSESAMPRIPDMNIPQPTVPTIAARPATLHQEGMQGVAGIASAQQEEAHERRYSDPIAFIQDGRGSAQPSDGITYYGGEGRPSSSDGGQMEK